MAQATAYKIHNMSRAVETRHLRAASSAQRAPKKLLLGGGVVRVLRGRPATVAERALRRMLPELVKREARGELKVTNMAGQRVDLSTLKPIEPPAPEEPKPNPPLDSAANDKQNVGEHKPQHVGGAAAGQKLETPAVVTSGVPEGSEEPSAELVEAIYESGTRKELERVAASLGVDPDDGNKTDLATRLAQAGYTPPEE